MPSPVNVCPYGAAVADEHSTAAVTVQAAVVAENFMTVDVEEC